MINVGNQDAVTGTVVDDDVDDDVDVEETKKTECDDADEITECNDIVGDGVVVDNDAKLVVTAFVAVVLLLDDVDVEEINIDDGWIEWVVISRDFVFEVLVVSDGVASILPDDETENVLTSCVTDDNGVVLVVIGI